MVIAKALVALNVQRTHSLTDNERFKVLCYQENELTD